MDNEQKRIRYNRLIKEKEEQAAEIRYQQRNMEEYLGQIQHEVKKSFRELQELNEEDIKAGGRSNINLQHSNDLQERKFKRYLHDTGEKLNEQYHSELKQIEVEKDELYRKRRRLQ